MISTAHRVPWKGSAKEFLDEMRRQWTRDPRLEARRLR